MADDKPASGADLDRKTTEHIVELLAGLALLGALVNGLLNYFDSLQFAFLNDLWAYFLAHIWPLWKIIAAILSAAALAGVAYNTWQLNKIDAAESKIFGTSPEAAVESDEDTPDVKNDRWQKIINYTNSQSNADWRLAIIEADVLLEELLRKLGYHGESVGEMLKSIDRNEFNALDDAWEAHKARNKVAHARADYQLNQRETKRIIALFERVFQEFELI